RDEGVADVERATVVGRRALLAGHLQDEVAVRLVGAEARLRLAEHGGDLLGADAPLGVDPVADLLDRAGARARPVPEVVARRSGPAGPQGLLVELDLLARDAAEDGGAHRAVADRQRALLPLLLEVRRRRLQRLVQPA